MRKPHRRTWDRTAVSAALWALYKRGADLRQDSVKEYDPGLVDAVRRYYGSWPGAFEDIGIPLNYTAKRKWNKKKVVEAIKEREREKKGLWYKEAEREDKGLVRATIRHFGTWQAAVEAAGYDYNKIRMTQAWSKRRVMSEILHLESRGENLSYGHVSEKHSKLFGAGKNWFGSWKNAVLAAGIDYESHLPHLVWSEERIINAIKKRVSQGKAINSAAVVKDDNKLTQAARQYFGTWTEAVGAAGFDYQNYAPKPVRKWNRETVKEAIRKRYKEGMNLNMKAIRKEDSGLMSAGTKSFGSWKSAIEAAGIDYAEISLIPIWTKEKVLKNVKQLKASGADLISTKVAAEHDRLFWWAVHFFGGWEKAVRAAGITNYNDYRKFRQWDGEKVKKCIRKRIREGKKINAGAVQRDDGGLVMAANRIFGTWEKAVEAAGIDYEKHRINRRWNKDVVVETIKDRMRQGKAINRWAVQLDDTRLFNAAERHFGSWPEAVKAAKNRGKRKA